MPVSQTVMECIKAGRLETMLHGTQLQGRFVLISMRGQGRSKDHWLLIKMQDAYARPKKRVGAIA